MQLSFEFDLFLAKNDNDNSTAKSKTIDCPENEATQRRMSAWILMVRFLLNFTIQNNMFICVSPSVSPFMFQFQFQSTHLHLSTTYSVTDDLIQSGEWCNQTFILLLLTPVYLTITLQY